MTAISHRNIELSKVNLSTGLINVQAFVRLFCEHSEVKQGEMFRLLESFQGESKNRGVVVCVCS